MIGIISVLLWFCGWWLVIIMSSFIRGKNFLRLMKSLPDKIREFSDAGDSLSIAELLTRAAMHASFGMFIVAGVCDMVAYFSGHGEGWMLNEAAEKMVGENFGGLGMLTAFMILAAVEYAKTNKKD